MEMSFQNRETRVLIVEDSICEYHAVYTSGWHVKQKRKVSV